MNCPHCDHEITEAEIKSLWSAYCNGRIPPHKRGGGAKPWAKHSDRAGLRCRCEDCIRLREIRLAEYEKDRPVEAQPDLEDLTWDTIKVNPHDAYEALIRHEKSKIKAARKHKIQKRLKQTRFQIKMAILKDRAQKEGKWDKVMKEAIRRP